MVNVSPEIKKILSNYGLKADEALWDCHGTAVMYHKYIEQIAANAKIETTFERVLYADEKSCAIVIKGDNGDRIEWTTGEASPKNNKNAYPWAMAEKRAKDRVILKLIGLAGHIYSDVDIADHDNKENPFEIDIWDEWADKQVHEVQKINNEKDLEIWAVHVREAFLDCKKSNKKAAERLASAKVNQLELINA